MELAYACAAQKKLALALIMASGLIGIVRGDSGENATETEARRRPYISYNSTSSLDSTASAGKAILIVGIVAVVCLCFFVLQHTSLDTRERPARPPQNRSTNPADLSLTVQPDSHPGAK